MRATLLALVLFPLLPRCTNAQSSPYQAAISATAALRAAPATQVPGTPATLADDLVAARRFNSRAPGATLMIVGGASIVAGILVGGSGGTVLVVGGVVLGAYGFYLYQR